MRTDSELAVEHLNEHGGVGGRPLQIEHCTAAGSPGTSQACAHGDIAMSGTAAEMSERRDVLEAGYLGEKER